MIRRGAAHGKVILFGEHAVVYGVPALAVGIERGVTVEATPRTRDPVSDHDERPARPPPTTLHVRGWNVTVSDDANEASLPLARALRAIVGVTRDEQRVAGRIPVGPVTIEAVVELPPGSGLGCSAALGVAVARALDPAAPADVIAARVTVWERVFHGNPSGIDAAVASLGGCVLFQRNSVGDSANEGASTSSITRVRVPSALQVCIGHSGQSSSTITVVEAVARLRHRRPESVQRTFDAIHTLVRNGRLAIEAGDARAVGQLLDLNQMLLSGLFVSTPEIEQMCATARSAGALGAKLTGAGGGGCVVALAPDAKRCEDILAAWKHEGFEAFATTFGGETRMSRETAAELDVLAGVL